MTFRNALHRRGLVRAAVLCVSALLIACAGGSGDNGTAASPPSSSTDGTLPPATATPRPAKLVVEPEPSFVPAAGASRTLVLRSGLTSLAVSTDTGAVREILSATPAVEGTGDLPPPQFPFAFSPDGASFAFACDDAGERPYAGYNNNLCIRRAGSPSAEIVTRGGALEAFGAYPPYVIQWSPDGRRISFQKRTRDNAQVSDVYVLDLQSQSATRVIANAGNEPWGPVRWSSDGTRFLIQRLWEGAGRSSDLFEVNASTGASTDLTQGPDWPQRIPDFSWSPDGKEVAFVGVRRIAPYDTALFVVGADGGTARKVMFGAITNGQMAWSPDGRWIAITVDVRDPGAPYFKYRVFAVRADGGEERALPDEITGGTGPVWAADSSHIALLGTVHGRRGIVVTSIRGATPKVVSDQTVWASPDFIAWSADATRVFFTQGRFCGQGGCTPGLLYMADLASGTPPRKLYEQPIIDVVSALPY